MMKRFETSGWWVLLVAPVFLAAACAGEGGGKSSRITLADPWARAMPFLAEEGEAGVNSAVYLRIRNEGSAPDRLLGGETSAAGAVEIHESFLEGEIMRMRAVDGLEIPAGAVVELRPGGLHVMLLDLQEPLLAGEELGLTLHFQEAGALETTVPIRAPASE